MRFSRTSWLILGTGILTIIFVNLYLNYSQRVRQRDALLQSIEAAQQPLPNIYAEKRDLEPQLIHLEEKLAMATSQLNEVKASYPPSVEEIEYGTELCEIADDCALVVTSLSNEAATEKLEGTDNYIATSFNMKVTGETDDLLNFISLIAESRPFSCASMDYLDMSNTGEDEPSLQIILTIYSYKSD